MRVLFALISRAFWIGICMVLIIGIFTTGFAILSGLALMLCVIAGLMLIFSIMRLATAPIRPPVRVAAANKKDRRGQPYRSSSQ